MPLDSAAMFKGTAKNLFHSLFDSLDSKKASEESPPLPPPKNDDPIPSFNNLSVNSSQWTPGGFVGGFNPTYAVDPYAYQSSAPSGSGASHGASPPVVMPTPFDYPDRPQSLTMQMALQPTGAGTLSVPKPPPRPHSNPLPEPPARPSISSTPSTPAKPPKKTAASVSTPTTPVRRARLSSAHSSSSSPAPTPKPGQEQCAGVTKAGKRCARMVKVVPALSAFDDDDDEASMATLPRFCHQHAKELMGPSGYYARKNGEWVKFEDWIQPYLQPETQVALRVEMEKSHTQADVDGYIYTFEIREPDEKDTIKLKVGRAVNLVKRIDQWGKQCGSKEQVLRGFYPGSVEPDEDGNEGSLMKGRVKAGEKGAWCHRLERLIHLELSDLTCNTPYLSPDWPRLDAPPAVDGAASGSKDSRTLPCPDCGSMHKEIFEFKRWKKGKYRGKEWDELVKPVIHRWGAFVENYV